MFFLFLSQLFLDWWREHRYSFPVYLILLEMFFLFLSQLFLPKQHSVQFGG